MIGVKCLEYVADRTVSRSQYLASLPLRGCLTTASLKLATTLKLAVLVKLVTFLVRGRKMDSFWDQCQIYSSTNIITTEQSGHSLHTDDVTSAGNETFAI